MKLWSPYSEKGKFSAFSYLIVLLNFYLSYFVLHVNFKNILFTITKPVYNTALNSHLMERGCNMHVVEYFDKLPRKNVSLSKKQSLLWSALLYGKSK